jgi:hypothetical protein
MRQDKGGAALIRETGRVAALFSTPAPSFAATGLSVIPQRPTKIGIMFPGVPQLGLDNFAQFVSRRASVHFRALFQLSHSGLVYVVDPERGHAQ